ncbi:MAG: magnesium/cobalt efflux protein [Gammaproteobacteria bacterium CG11_big_fil_rev_8_21_14_0_20_46_22]|nr:MAG: magnesium/cobalt efflux protein [Gammaproteobacteria bacterium CG12_big_fil_rev_8_21_14_0_65_46_12]PIR10925.1 MAG: magnesium/cobalt efflux protein [Gammaproteobacteria bacterium CG11_big_fil_rev_8_21_14_0_20_46_22]
MSNTPSKGLLERFMGMLSGSDEPKNRAELIDILEDAEKNRLLKHDAMEMIRGAITVADRRVEDVMITRSQMVTLEMDKPLPELLNVMIESGHSRFPVIGKDIEDVRGLLLAKDVLRYFVLHEHEGFDLHTLLRPVVTVPESKRLDMALKEFRANHTHMALVADEHGVISGLLTIEDILEQIVGNIEDEHDLEDDEPEKIRQASTSHYIVDALTEIEDFNTYFDAELPTDEFDTIGGLVTHRLGHVPQKGEHCTLKGLKFQVINADERRVLQLSLHHNRDSEN